MTDVDVTKSIDYGSVDDECMPIFECICGEKFGHWKFVISIYDDPKYINPCPKCGRKFYFRNSIRVYEVHE